MTATTTAPRPLHGGSAFPPRARDDVRARRFARLWRLMDAGADQQIRSAKEALLTELPARLVELGPGCGANFRYFPRGTQVIAFEPNVYFHDELRAAASRHGVVLDLRAGGLAAGELPAASQDVVVSTLVLCSVSDVDAVLAEIRRILRPGGRLIFIEHVAAASGTVQGLYQRVVRRAWRALGDGCDPCARTVDAIAHSGLRVVEARLERFGSSLDPTNLIYWGVAEK